MVAVSVLDVALALTCLESALFGIFSVLAVTSLCVLVVRHGKENSANSKSSALVFTRVACCPLFIATEAFVFVASAALYTTWTLLFLVSYAASSVLYAFAFHYIPAATGISFMLIFVRGGPFSSWTETPLGALRPAGGTRSTLTSVAVGGHPSSTSTGARLHGAPARRRFALSVTQTVERETDFGLPQVEDKRTVSGDADSDFGLTWTQGHHLCRSTLAADAKAKLCPNHVV
ncbi:hypothetical protein C8Q80DRAFT_1124192 [Daedaleopsis nitida]|nr:hypothetical protein C8Q80DRAFT_1124192 [Daedaleopsis nitida]